MANLTISRPENATTNAVSLAAADKPRATPIRSSFDGQAISPHRWMTAIAVMSCAVMQLLDTSVVNVSLPHIAGSLSSSVDEATWVLTSYLVANAIILP
ncbi:MAG: hypothetical protein ABSD61_13210, partial [Terracidiphilus sp.]